MGPFEESFNDAENGVVWELLLLSVLGADELTVERHRFWIKVRTEAVLGPADFDVPEATSLFEKGLRKMRHDKPS